MHTICGEGVGLALYNKHAVEYMLRVYMHRGGGMLNLRESIQAYTAYSRLLKRPKIIYASVLLASGFGSMDFVLYDRSY